MDVMTRDDARALGRKKFFSGIPCANGHLAERYVRNGQCIECRKQRYDQEVARDYNMAYRAKNKAALSDYDKAKYQKVAARHRKEKRLLFEKLKDQLDAERVQKQLFLRKMAVERVRAWRLQNPGKKQSLHAKRRSSKKRAVPLWFSEFDAFVWNEAAELAIRRKAATGINWHVDHMIPLSARKASGLHVASNCQVIPQVLNNRKHNKLVLTSPGEWIARL
jgi:hypothetical protein